MKNVRKLLGVFSPFLVAAFMLSSCVSDDLGGKSAKKDGEIVISIRVPGVAQLGTRAIAENSIADNLIEEVDILLFDSNDDYLQTLNCTNIVTNPSDPREKTIKARLSLGTYKMVILANAHDMVIANPVTGADQSREIVIASFVKAFANYGDKWFSDGTDANYKGFPMWGEVSGMTTVTGSGGAAISASMYRMLSKINIAVEYSETLGVKDFELTSIDVFNYNKSGYLAPTTIASVNPVDSKEGAVASPVSLNYGSSYIINDVTNSKFVCKDEIFVMESAANSGAWSWENNTCVVIGGKYKGAATSSYYRLDFTQDGTTMLDLLRNHSYTISVAKIKTIGYEDPWTALKNRAENTEYTVVPWDDSKIGDLIVDGPTQLTVTPSSKVLFPISAETQSVDIYTNWSKGWQIQKLPGDPSKYRIVDNLDVFQDWVTIDNEGTIAAGEKALAITVTENNTGADRTAYIYITCGRIEHRLTVVQDLSSRLQLLVTDIMNRDINTITVSATAPLEQIVKVRFQPKSSDLNIEVTKIGANSFNFGIGDAMANGSYIGLNGAKNYQFKPLSYNLNINPFLEMISKVEFMVSDGVDIATKTIYLRQVNYAITTDQYDYYSLNNVEQTLTVKSNTTWKVKSVTGNEEILSGMTFANIAAWSGGNNEVGEAFKFTFIEDLLNVHKGKSIVIVLTDPSGKVTDFTVTLNALACGLRGQTARRTIGPRQYETQAYAGNLCWMVQNSWEGSPTYTYYFQNGAAGYQNYYYSRANTPGACPAGTAGWRLPSSAEVTAAANFTNSTTNIGYLSMKYWWTRTDTALKGFKPTYNDWLQWSTHGHWFATGAAYHYYSSPAGMNPTPDGGGEGFMSVRCVSAP